MVTGYSSIVIMQWNIIAYMIKLVINNVDVLGNICCITDRIDPKDFFQLKLIWNCTYGHSNKTCSLFIGFSEHFVNRIMTSF